MLLAVNKYQEYRVAEEMRKITFEAEVRKALAPDPYAAYYAAAEQVLAKVAEQYRCAGCTELFFEDQLTSCAIGSLCSECTGRCD